MEIVGNHELDVRREKLWVYLMDPVVLAKITPGISKLNALGGDRYETVANINIGPVNATFKGKMQVAEKNHPETFQIQVEQLSKVGNAHVTVHMKLSEVEGDRTLLAFNGKAKLSGTIARTGQRVLSGVANLITKQVFSALEKFLAKEKEQAETS